MYKLTLDSINQIKSTTGYSGTIETDRVAIVDGDGKFLQVDGNWGSELKNGLTCTYSATLDVATTDMLKAKYTSKSADTAAVYVYDGIMALQADYDSVDLFIEHLVDTGVITIQGYTSKKYKLKAATIKTAGSGYTAESVVVTVPGQTGDTAGTVTVTISEGACSSAEITTAGAYETFVKSQTLDVTGGTGKITVTMEEAE